MTIPITKTRAQPLGEGVGSLEAVAGTGEATGAAAPKSGATSAAPQAWQNLKLDSFRVPHWTQNMGGL